MTVFVFGEESVFMDALLHRVEGSVGSAASDFSACSGLVFLNDGAQTVVSIYKQTVFVPVVVYMGFFGMPKTTSLAQRALQKRELTHWVTACAQDTPDRKVYGVLLPEHGSANAAFPLVQWLLLGEMPSGLTNSLQT